ncbi:nitroreductase family protein [Limosilactobacillus difficilis]|uniref:nitroreductase family protein n=1 Tax=Limosilactobacillus difficilis TaxID=2991838 RepID=UPI0024B89C5F|nr:nitroreductase family protein [Limosilactobacillus difficilis]
MENIIQKRRSIRKFSNKAIDESAIQQLVDAFQASPCGMHETDVMQAVVVTDPTLLSRIAKTTDNAAYGAPLLFLIATKNDSKFGERDASAAAENVMIQATALGLGSVYVMSGALKINSDSQLLSSLGLEQGYQATVMVPVGRAAESGSNDDRHARYHVVYK